MDDQKNSLITRELSVSYQTQDGLLKAVDEVDLELKKGLIHAVVGESGCGKSTLGLSLSKLGPKERVVYSGEVTLEGTNLLALDDNEMQRYRGTRIATIFQEPMTSLDPVYRIGEQIAEALFVREKRGPGMFYENKPDIPRHRSLAQMFGVNRAVFLRSKRLYNQHSSEVRQLLEKVRISDPDRVAKMYPHELSGGMRQRAVIAMALSQNPSFLVADEITTALDVTTQARILALIKELAKETGMGVLMVTHDLGVVAAVADSVSVMYAGKFVEQAQTSELYKNPLHPYTVGLMRSFPKGRKDKFELKAISGSVPPIWQYPSGCRFHPRCPSAFATCSESIPKLQEVSKGHLVACFLYGGGIPNA
jgi:peptide/nickel transport system ATP-binding protein